MSRKATDDDAKVESANGKFKEKDKEYEEGLKVKKALDVFSRFHSYPLIIHENKNLSFPERNILWAIYLHTNDPEKLEGWDACRPSQTTLANFCGFRRQNIGPHIKSLIEKGYVMEEKRAKQTSKFFLAKKLLLDLAQSSYLIRKNKRDNLPDLCKIITEIIDPKKRGLSESRHVRLSESRQGIMSESRHELDCTPELDLNSELELKDTHTQKKSAISKKRNGKRKGVGDLSFSMSEKNRKNPPTPLSSQNKTVKNSVTDIGDVQIKRKGEKVMAWDKKGKKGGFHSSGGVDKTEGLAISKSSQTRRTPDAENGKEKTTKWTRLVNEVQTTFKQKALTHQGGILSSGAQHGQLAKMVKNLGGLAETKAVIEYAIEHWDELRSQDKKLLSEPNLNNMLVDWRYLEWKDMMQMESQRVELPKNRQETPMKRVKLTAVK